MRFGRHPSWNKLDELIRLISKKYGGMIYDKRCGKSWDPGQAICAEQFGSDWATNKEFRRLDSEPDSEFPNGALEAAERVLSGKCDWIEVDD